MRQKGSYTVEAALLMGILLSVLVSEIYLGFWYHDRNFLQKPYRRKNAWHIGVIRRLSEYRE